MMVKESIAVIGTGYVGLVTGACLAHLGHDVHCMDIDSQKIASLEKGQIPFFEPGLSHIVLQNVAQKRLSFSASMEEALSKANLVFIAVGTPSRSDGSADLSFVEQAIDNLARYAKRDLVVIMKSTVPIGTNRRLQARLQNAGSVHSFFVVSNPEFLREGSAITDFQKPDRIVVGGLDEIARSRVMNLYSSIATEKLSIDWESAETIKYASNAFLATKISFANFISQVCDATGAQVNEVTRGMGLDNRIGKPFLNAGLGYGGSCFPKDVAEFSQFAQKTGLDASLLQAVEKINISQRKRFFERIVHSFHGALTGQTIAVWGIAFKPFTDDIREAPALSIVQWLLDGGARVQAFDPEAMDQAKKRWPSVSFGTSPAEVCRNADALVILTEWPVFRDFDKSILRDSLKRPLVFDGRNIWNPVEMKQLGFDYYSIGRPISSVQKQA